MKLFSRSFILLGIIIGLVSCGEDSALKEETIYLQAENKGWITGDPLGSSFVMIDNNGISQSFTMNGNNRKFRKNIARVFGITTEITHIEYRYQAYTSNYETSYSLSLIAGSKPFGDDLRIKLGRIEFSYNLKLQTVSQLTLMTGATGYESKGEDIFSTVELLEAYSTTLHAYNTVLHFQLKDFKNKWNAFTVTDIYVAKSIGLIEYELNNGVIYERK